MGIGFYSMLHVQETSPIVNEQKKVVKININIGYTTTFYQYAFTLGKRWAFGIPVEIGGGSYKITATDALGKRDTSFTDTLSRGILLFGTGLKVDFKVFKWVGLNLMGGRKNCWWE